MQTFQQYFYENKTILSHIMESRSGKWDIFIKFASSFEVLSFSIRFFAKFGRHFVSYLFGKPLAYRMRAAGIVGDDLNKVSILCCDAGYMYMVRGLLGSLHCLRLI